MKPKNSRNELKFHDQIIELAWRRIANYGFPWFIILFRRFFLAALMTFQTSNCNSEFLESKRRELKFLHFENPKFHTFFKHLKTYSVLCRILSKFNSSKYKSCFSTWYNFFLGKSYFWGERPHASWPNLTFRRDFVWQGNVNKSTSLSSLSVQTIEKTLPLIFIKTTQ